MKSLGRGEIVKKAMWLYPKVSGFSPSERSGHSTCCYSGVVYIFGAGVVASLDTLVKEFISASNVEKKAVLSKIEEEADKLEGSAARLGKIYKKAAKSCLEKGSDYAKKEIERLQHILEKSISSAKADEFTLKKNILSTFAA